MPGLVFNLDSKLGVSHKRYAAINKILLNEMIKKAY